MLPCNIGNPAGQLVRILVRRKEVKGNVGNIDRVLRVLIGIALVVIGFVVIQGTAGIVVGVIGVIPLLTGLIGWCPLYILLKD